jgi:hypothetical protein
MDTKLRNLLHDLATEMPVDVEGSAPRTLRKARGRRILTAGAGVAVAVAFVVVSVSVFRFGGEPTLIPAVTGPSQQPVGFEGLWPETDAEALAVTQEAIDDGHQPLRTTPDGTARLLAVNLLGWQEPDVLIASSATDGDEATVVIGNRVFSDSVPPIRVEVRQLGDTGPNGLWSVIGVSTPLIELEPIRYVDPPGTISFSARVSEQFAELPQIAGPRLEGALVLDVDMLDGPAADPTLGGGFAVSLTDGSAYLRFGVTSTPDGRATLLLTMPDATGASLGAVMTLVETPIGEAQTVGVDVTGVPPDVAVTAQRIYDAAKAKDFDALAELLDPNTFVYNFDDGSDPIPAWRQDPSVLDLMGAVLELPAAVPRVIEGYGTFTIWPYLIDSDFAALSERERADLASLGYTEEDIQLMIDGGHGYQGPRLAIDETGLWRNFITVGE